MSDDDNILTIRVTSAPNQVAAIKSIRTATGLSMSEIKAAIADQTPITVAKLYRVDHDENEQIANSLFDELETSQIDFDIILDGHVEPREYFTNAMQRWREIGVHTEMMSDLESGEPCIETLEWLRSSGTEDVFRKTLQQIINADGYNVDAETLEWAKRQMNDA